MTNKLPFEGFGFDLEADNLYLQSKNIWTGHLKSFCGKYNVVINPYKEGKEVSKKKVLEYLDNFEDGLVVLGHNHLGYDLWMLWKFLEIPFIKDFKGNDYLYKKKVNFIDTLPLSMFLAADRFGGHSLDALASKFGSYKIDFRQKLIDDGTIDKRAPKGEEFRQYHPLMEEYCDQDVNATIRVLKEFSKQMTALYGDKWWLHKAFRNNQKDYYLYSAQEFAGVKFDKEAALKTIKIAEDRMEELEKKILPRLPPRALKKGEEKHYTMPALPFKKNEELSASMIKWIDKHEGVFNKEDGTVTVYGKTYPIKSKFLIPMKVPMELKDGGEMKEWFMENGWVPIYWNTKKDENGKPMRDDQGEPITTSPKIQEMGNICPNLLRLEAELPKQVVDYLSLKNRKAIASGWLNNWRLDFDGRLSGKISGYTPTFRVKHSEVCNVPKAQDEVILGKEFRAMFCTEEGNWFVGTDASALENRTLGHYTHKYDGGAFANLMLEGDPHTASAFAFFPEETKGFDINDPNIKEDPIFKPLRGGGKTGNYLLAYGGSANKLGKSLGLGPARGKVAYENYWNMNPGLKAFKEALEKYWSSKGKKKVVPGIDGRMLNIRSKHVLVNYTGQSCGAIVMSVAACKIDEKLGGMRYIDELGRPYYMYKGCRIVRVLMVHDEFSYEVWDSKEVAEEVAEISRQAIIDAGVELNLRLELDGEGKVGTDWCSVH